MLQCAPDALLTLISRWNALVDECYGADYYPAASGCLPDVLYDFYTFVAWRRGLTPASGCAKDILELLGQDSLLWDCDSPATVGLSCPETETCEPHIFSTGAQVDMPSHAYVAIGSHGVGPPREIGIGNFPVVFSATGFSVTAEMSFSDDCYSLIVEFVVDPLGGCPVSGTWTATFRRYASAATWECAPCSGALLGTWTASTTGRLYTQALGGGWGLSGDAWWHIQLGLVEGAQVQCDTPCVIVPTTQYRYILTIADESSCSRVDPIGFTTGETYGLGLQLQSSDDGGSTWANYEGAPPDGDTALGGTTTPTTTPNTGWSLGYKALTGVEISTGALTASGMVNGVTAAGSLTVLADDIDWCLPSWDTHGADAGLANTATPTWSATVNSVAFAGDLTWTGSAWTFSDTVGADTLSGTLTIQAKGEYPSTNCSTLKRILNWTLTGGGFDFGSGGDADFTWAFASDFSINTGVGDDFDFSLNATCREACCGGALFDESLQARQFLAAITAWPDLGGTCGALLEAWVNGSVRTLTYGATPGGLGAGYAFFFSETVAGYVYAMVLTGASTGTNWDIYAAVRRTIDADYEWCGGWTRSPNVSACCPEQSDPGSWGVSGLDTIFALSYYCQCASFETHDTVVSAPGLVVAIARA